MQYFDLMLKFLEKRSQYFAHYLSTLLTLLNRFQSTSVEECRTMLNVMDESLISLKYSLNWIHSPLIVS